VIAFACLTFRIHEQFSNADAPKYGYCQAFLKRKFLEYQQIKYVFSEQNGARIA
jgi:hypothetical protein